MSGVVPVLDEAATLPGLLRSLGREVDEVVVADGGSTDGSVDLALAAGARVVHGRPGRGPQLNAGAGAARGEVFWFVHADTGVPPGAGRALRTAAGRVPWGCFSTRIDSGDPRLRFCGRWMTWRARLSGSCTGDMGMWCTRRAWEELGGFPPWLAFEDLDLSDRARARFAWAVVEPALTTSARRWEVRGVNRTILRMWALRAGFRLGVDPGLLGQGYGR